MRPKIPDPKPKGIRSFPHAVLCLEVFGQCPARLKGQSQQRERDRPPKLAEFLLLGEPPEFNKVRPGEAAID